MEQRVEKGSRGARGRDLRPGLTALKGTRQCSWQGLWDVKVLAQLLCIILAA